MSADPLAQPAPTPGEGPAIWDLILAELEAGPRPLSRLDETLLADMRARDALGEARYGTRLRAHNGRDALSDAYAEALDGLVYLRQVLEECRAEPGSRLHRAYQRQLEQVRELAAMRVVPCL